MSHVRLSGLTIAGAIVTTIIVGVVTVSGSARAQSTGKAQCAENPESAAKVQAWMNQQIAAGRTHFVGLASMNGAADCAW